MASWQIRCMKTKPDRERERKKMLSISPFCFFPQINKECSTETGVKKRDVKKQRKDGRGETERGRERERGKRQ